MRIRILLLFLSLCISASAEPITPRELRVYLPPNYDSTGHYPVLYMHDGQNLFDTLATHVFEWRIDESLDSMIRAGFIEPLIVVGIPHGAEFRRAEYVPVDVLDKLDDSVRGEFMQLIAHEPRSREYLDYLIGTVIPSVDSLYATDTTRRYIGGSSTGAIGALAVALTTPARFAGVLCFSTHWTGLFRQNDPIPQAYLNYVAENLPAPGVLRFYFDHGDEGLDSLYAPNQMRVDSLFHARGYESTSFRSQSFPLHTHNEQDWARRFPAALQWMLKP
ncbi:MAG: alpha/beta hydrolase [bacterium]|nr:alpha/beta hydrolase [bacterium]